MFLLETARQAISFRFFASALFVYAAFNATARAQTPVSAGTALNFNGANNYVSVNLSSPPASNYTISAWVFLRTGGVLNNPRMAVLSSTTCDASIELLIRSATSSPTDPQYLELGRCTGFNGFASTAAIPLNTWTHVAATFSSSKTVSYYINGVPAGTFTDSNAAHNYALGTAVNFGDNSGVRKFDGMLDQVEIWNRVLSPLEIMLYRDLRLAGNENGLYAYYPFDEGAGTTTANSATGGASAGTLVNSPAWANSSLALYQFLPLTNTLATGNLMEGPSAGSDSIVMAVSPLAPNWTNTNNASWLHLNPANTTGSGSTNIIFTFDQNTGATRTGTLSIASQTLTVTQVGATYIPMLLMDGGPPDYNLIVASLVPSGAKGITNNQSAPINCEGLAVDAAGNVYFPDATDNVIKKWAVASNSVTTIVPSGVYTPISLAVDGAGNVYIGNDLASPFIQRWDAMTQTLTPVLTNGVDVPQGLALDGAGNLYIADQDLNSIFKWSPWSNTLAAVVTGLNKPTAVYVDVAGNLYYSDFYHIRMLSAANGSTTVLATDSVQIEGFAVDPSGNIYFGDDTGGQFYKRSVLDGSIASTVNSAGEVFFPLGMAADGAGNVYIDDFGNANSANATPRIEVAMNAYVDSTPPILPGNGGAVTPGMAPLSPLLSDLLIPLKDPPFQNSWLTVGVSNGLMSITGTPNLTHSTRSSGVILRYVSGYGNPQEIEVAQPSSFITLSITNSGSQSALSWSPTWPGLTLQESATLNPANWTDSLSGTNNPANIIPAGSSEFYRVKSQ